MPEHNGGPSRGPRGKARRARRILLAAFFAVTATAHAAPLDDLLGDGDKNWTEIPPPLPAPAESVGLVSFYVSPNTSFRFVVDPASISLGKDGVVHYVLIGISSEGARNVSFQGMRCATREVKTYAYGRSDGSWGRSRNESWARIGESDGNREIAALYKDIFCKDGFPLNLKQVLDRLHTNPYASLPY